MAAEHLHALKARLAPERSMRSLCKDAGVVHSTVAYYFKPDYEPHNMPPMVAMGAIAQALGCELVEVSRACAADVGLELEQEMLTTNERALLEGYRELGARDQYLVRHMINAMRQLGQETEWLK